MKKMINNKTFEENIDALEKITAELSREGITLEESLALYQQGVELSRVCNQYLEDTERTIKMLRVSNDGEVEEKDLPENN